jgi:hypothetical protein
MTLRLLMCGSHRESRGVRAMKPRQNDSPTSNRLGNAAWALNDSNYLMLNRSGSSYLPVGLNNFTCPEIRQLSFARQSATILLEFETVCGECLHIYFSNRRSPSKSRIVRPR